MENQDKLKAREDELVSDEEMIRSLPLPDDKKNDIIATLEMYSGPIPHPKILAGYEALDHGAAKKIIDNGIKESEHRRQMETSRQKRRGRLAWVSMFAVIIICVLFIFLSFVLIMHGHPIIGSVFGGGSFLAFLGSLNTNVNDLSKKDDISVSDHDIDKK